LVVVTRIPTPEKKKKKKRDEKACQTKRIDEEI
jgi:hypothetical protein